MNEKFKKLISWISTNPKSVFMAMVLFIVVSLANFALRTGKQKEKGRDKWAKDMHLENGLNDGLGVGALIEETTQLKETYRMKNSIDSLLSKESLTTEDSVLLMQNLQRLKTVAQSKFE